MKYHKIDSVFMRDPATKFRTFLPEYSRPEFELLKNCEWELSEKCDGFSTRSYWDGEGVAFAGRNDNSQMPVCSMQRLQDIFTPAILGEIFPTGDEPAQIVLYSEMCGEKIQKGGAAYCPEGGQTAILFDVRIGHIWLKRKDVDDIAQKLGVKSVPIIGTGTLGEALQMCKMGFASQLRDTEPEGLVCRPKHELLDRMGRRIITKIKLKDFR